MNKLAEKPDGARSVASYEVNIQRAYRPIWTLTSKNPVFFDSDTCARLHIIVDFYDDGAASEFQQRVIAMMPGVEP